MYRLPPLQYQFKGIITVSVLRALAMASLSPIFALYLKRFVESDFIVSLVFTVSYLFALIATIYGSLIIEKLQKRKTMIAGLLLFSAVIVLFSVAQSSLSVVILFILYTFLFSLLFFGISLYIDHLSTKKNLATHFGENGSLTNLSWIVGPILGGVIADKLSYVEVFLLASLFAFIGLIVFVFSEPPDKRQKVHHHVHIFSNTVTFFKKPFLRRMYLQGLGYCIFYGAIALAPLFFQELGTPVERIGLFLGLSAVPWILLELPIGRHVDKRKNEKLFFISTYGLLIPALMLFGLSSTPFLAFVFLALTSVATAFSETTVLSYFYRFVPESDIGSTSVFLTFPSLGLFLGTLYTTIILNFTNLKGAYVILGILLIPFLFTSLKIKPKKRLLRKVA